MTSRQKPKSATKPAPVRNIDEFNQERLSLDAAHLQNENGRDTFLGLAHTAMFAASISFVGDVTPLNDAIFKPVLFLGWSLDVVGLVSLTCSFQAARYAIDRRREALNESTAPDAKWAERLNGVALWTFPFAVLCIFAFVSVNLFHMTSQTPKPPTAPVVIQKGATPPQRAPSHVGPTTPSTGVVPGPRAPEPAPTPAPSPPSPKK